MPLRVSRLIARYKENKRGRVFLSKKLVRQCQWPRNNPTISIDSWVEAIEGCRFGARRVSCAISSGDAGDVSACSQLCARSTVRQPRQVVSIPRRCQCPRRRSRAQSGHEIIRIGAALPCPFRVVLQKFDIGPVQAGRRPVAVARPFAGWPGAALHESRIALK